MVSTLLGGKVKLFVPSCAMRELRDLAKQDKAYSAAVALARKFLRHKDACAPTESTQEILLKQVGMAQAAALARWIRHTPRCDQRHMLSVQVNCGNTFQGIVMNSTGGWPLKTGHCGRQCVRCVVPTAGTQCLVSRSGTMHTLFNWHYDDMQDTHGAVPILYASATGLHLLPPSDKLKEMVASVTEVRACTVLHACRIAPPFRSLHISITTRFHCHSCLCLDFHG